MTTSIPDTQQGPGGPERRPNLVQFDLGPWRFSAPLVPILGFVLVLPLLVSLGFWQLDRAAQRIALMDSVEAARTQAPLSVDDERLLDANDRYLPVEVNGRLDVARQFLLDNRVNGKVAGYEVLTPLIYKPGKAVLINRGWLPVGQSRAQKPDVSVPASVAESVTLSGLAVVPPERFTLGEALQSGDDWPRLLQFEDFENIAAQLDLELLPRVLQPGQLEWGFQALWTPLEKGPEKNYAYALQWFALAATLFIITLVVCTQRRPEST